MHRLLVFLVGLPVVLLAADIQGTVLDPSGSVIPGAQVSVVNRLGVVVQASTNQAGAFDFKLSKPNGTRLVVNAAGFETRTISLDSYTSPLVVRLNLSARSDSISVVGSTMDVPVSEQGGSVSVIPSREIRERNEPLALDLLRYLPGLSISQVGGPGGATGLFIRGGDSDYNLVQIDGVPLNSFGGAFDFAHMPADLLDRVEVIRGPQSAVYGPYANAGVVNFVTRSADNSPPLSVIAEGGTYQERRFAVGSAGYLKGFGISAFVTRLDSNGPVVNSDYRNEDVSLNVSRHFGRHSLMFNGDFDSNESGVPGPYGSDPLGLFTGIDRVTRDKNNSSDYLVRYQGDLSSRLRQEVFASFFLTNSGFASPYGFSFNKDLRGQAETRTVISVNRAYTMAFGAAFSREEVKNTFISDSSFRDFPLRRDDEGIYWENRFQFANRLFWSAGVRAEILQTPLIPGDAFGSRPDLPGNTLAKVNPKLALAYVARKDRDSVVGASRLHTSFGTGFRPPSGFELAFTNNPALKPERTASFDVGLSQSLLHDRLSLDGSYFYNRYYDLIVSLGGSLARLSSYQSDNLANSQAQGAELSSRFRPARWLTLAASYTYLKSKILALNGSSNLAPAYFKVGQELLRRPAHSGGFVTTFVYRRLSANVTGYFRDSVLDVEPNLGASEGLFRNPGYVNLGINLNYEVTPGVTIYGNLRNALNQRYEEVFGYPSPLLNFVTGLKWTLARRR